MAKYCAFASRSVVSYKSCQIKLNDASIDLNYYCYTIHNFSIAVESFIARFRLNQCGVYDVVEIYAFAPSRLLHGL
jgi:hypothetical protein